MPTPRSFEFPQHNVLVVYDALCQPINITISPALPIFLSEGEIKMVIAYARDLIHHYVAHNAIRWNKSLLMPVIRAAIEHATVKVDAAVKRIADAKRPLHMTDNPFNLTR